MTRSRTVVVESPHGERRSLTVAWVDPGTTSAPVLLLQEMPGQAFWWSAPGAVVQAVERARDALDPDLSRWARAFVVGRVPARGSSGMTQYYIDLGPGQPVPSARTPRELPVPEADRALAYLGMR